MIADRNNVAEDSCLKNQRPVEGRHHLPQSVQSVQSFDARTPSNSVILEKDSSLTFKELLSSDLDIGLEAVGPSQESLDNIDNADCRYGATALDRAASHATLDFPEGGLEGWLVVFGSFCAMISVFGLINSSAVFESYFSTHQLVDNSKSEIGWIFSLYLFIVFFVGIQVGPVFDRYGGRVLVASGTALITASLLILSWCETYYQIILTYSVLGGLGGALLNCPAYGAIAHYFNVRRGLATGIATTSGGVGGVVFPLLLQHLLPNRGFPWSCRILAFIMLGLAIPANLFIRTRLPPHRPVSSSSSSSSSAGIPAVRPSVWPDVTIFRDARFAVASLGIVFMEWGLFIPLTFIVSYAAAHDGSGGGGGGDGNGDPTRSYQLLSYLNAASVAGRVLPGFLADRLGRFNVIVATIAMCAASVLALWLPARGSAGLLVAYAVVFGFASGSNLGLVPVCLGQLCDARQYGRYFSTAMMVASFGTLSSVPIGGALLEMGGGGDTGWMAVILFSGCAYLVALVCYAAARVLAVGWDPRTIF